MGKKLEITDLDKFIITGLSKTTVKFKYDNKRYKIVATDMDTHEVVLYRYRPRKNDYISIIKTTSYVLPSAYAKDVCSKKKQYYHVNYNLIDKRYFVKNMTLLGLFTGVYEGLGDIMKEERASIEQQIEELEQRISELREQKALIHIKYMGITGHGSKIYGEELKQKISDRDIDKGLKTGDYVEELDARIGDTDEWGAVLTDISTLPYGKMIEKSETGELILISCNSKGNKTAKYSKGKGGRHDFNKPDAEYEVNKLLALEKYIYMKEATTMTESEYEEVKKLRRKKKYRCLDWDQLLSLVHEGVET